VQGKEGAKAVEYTGLIALFVEAIKAHNDEIERLKTINYQQQEMLQILFKRVEALEKKIK